jgi:hypothetical protein
LVGAIVLGARQAGEAYARDDSAAIASSTHQNGELLSAINALRADLARYASRNGRFRPVFRF